MEFCCALVVALTTVAVVGRGIWAVAAAVLGQILGGTEPRPRPTQHRRRRVCPGCEHALLASDEHCPGCGLVQDDPLALQLEHTRTGLREVAALAERGELDAATADLVTARLRAHVHALTHPAKTTAIPVAEVAPEPAPEPEPASETVVAETNQPPSDIPPVPAPAPAPAAPESPPQRGALAGFMEERNIFWGELVGGLLIVGCSIALVLSLWKRLEEVPYFPFLLAAAITAALFGAGQYTLHHWRLAATSRGLLVISLLLTPLNLLLLGAPGVGSTGATLDLVVKAAALLGFVGMVRAAGRDLIGTDLLPGPIDRRWLLALAVVGAPATQWLPDLGWAPLPAWLPLACHAAACAAVLAGLTWYRRAAADEPFGERTASAVLVFAGVSLFALVAAWGLFLTRAADMPPAVRGLAVPLVIAAVPLLEAGLLVQRRRVPGHAGLTATATGVAVAGAGVLAVGVTLAWPDPLRLTLAAAVVGAILTRVTWREGIAWFQLGAAPALALAYVLGTQGVAGAWGALAWADPAVLTCFLLGTTASGMALVGLALVFLAVGDYAAGLRRHAIAQSYAVAAVAAGMVGLFLATVHGVGRVGQPWDADTQPWAAAGAHAACAAGLLLANVRWKQQLAAQAGVWLGLVTTLWTLEATRPERAGSWGFVVALEALVLAAGALVLTRRAARPGGVLAGQLRVACRDVAVAAAVLAGVLGLAGLDIWRPGGGEFVQAATYLTLFPTGLLLTRVSNWAGFTWAGSATALLGLVFFTALTLEIRPDRAAPLTALLTHATVVLLLAAGLRGKPARVRLFVNPLRATARVSAGLAVLFLVFPPPGHASLWAAFAVWLAALWFGVVWVWREAGVFSAAQVALAGAAVLAGFGWVERQEWSATTTQGVRDPRALRAVGTALGFLGAAWVVARRLVRGSPRLRDRWLRDPFAVDRLVVAAVVVAQLVVLAAAVKPGISAELTPVGMTVWPAPPELAHAFDASGWLLLGLLAGVLVAALRLRTPVEPDGDAAVVGLIVLLLTAPLLWAGAFAPEFAAASALRWGLAVAFVAGSAAVFLREPLGELAGATGFRPRVTPAATVWAYALLAAAAAVVVLLTGNVAALGLNRLTPSGPGEATAFAAMGWTASHVVPMALVVAGLAGTAARERLAGYAFAAGLVFVATLDGGYALSVVTAGGSLGPLEQLHLAMLAAGGLAAWAALWAAAERRVPGAGLLDQLAGAALVGVGLIALVPLAHVYAYPARPLHPAFEEFGFFGWPLLALAASVCYNRARAAPELRAHVIGVVGVVTGVLAACAVQPVDAPGEWGSFRAMAVTWVAVGLALTAAYFRAPHLAGGAWLGGFAAAVVLVVLRGPAPQIGAWFKPVALAGYALLSAGIAVRLARGTEGVVRWRTVLGVVSGVAVVALLSAVTVAVNEETFRDRATGPVAVALVAVTAGLLARAAPGAAQLRVAAVVLAAGAAALVGLAAPDPDEPAVWLRRNGWAFAVLTAAAAACLAPRVRLAPAWAIAAQRAGVGLALAALAWLVVVLLQQVPVFDPATRRTPLDLSEVLAVLAAIGVLIALALRAALRPGAVPERARPALVYLAEALFVLLFVHARLNLPELFVGPLVRYWTFVVMVLAFVWVGAAEVFERRGLAVLAGPVRRTGVLLPLVPLLAFWTKPPGFVLLFADRAAPGLRPFLGYLERLPMHFDSYAGLWSLTGVLYGAIALQRRSFGWAVLAALAANATLWSLLAHNDVPAAVHPQVWVIPLALIVLVSEHVNRRTLPPDLSTGMRYAGIGMLYLSSTADMFIAGIGNSVWLPVLLAVFCVAGILGGILLRVRAFLFLGTGFLFLDVFAMIWHAAVDRAQTWVWYASGIVLGAAILALFAVFEKRRDEVRGAVEELRRWD